MLTLSTQHSTLMFNKTNIQVESTQSQTEFEPILGSLGKLDLANNHKLIWIVCQNNLYVC